MYQVTGSKKLKEILKVAFESNLSILITGPPGIGKSEIFVQCVNEINEDTNPETPFTAEEVRLYLMEPGEAKGIPWLVNGETVWSRPSWLPKNENAVFFFDDIHNVNEYSQSTLYELLLCRRLHGHKVPDSTRFVAAGNLGLASANSSEIASPIMDRFDICVEFTPSLDSFLEYAVSQDFNDKLLAFLNSYGKDFFFTSDPPPSEKFPSPRSWFSCHNALQAGLGVDVSTGIVGVEAGARLIDAWAFLNRTLKDVLNEDPESLNLKDQVGSAAFLATYSPTNNIIKFVKKLPVDARACYFKLVLLKFPEKIGWLYQNPDMKEIANELASVLGD